MVPIHGEFSSADATALSEAASRFTMYRGGVALGTLTGSFQFVVTDVLSMPDTAQVLSVYDGSDTTVGAGERIFYYDGNAVISTHRFGVPHYCTQDTYPKVKCTAVGQIDVIIHGYLLQGADIGRLIRLGSV